MAKQAMATGRGFMLTAIKNDSSGAIRAKLVDQGDSCLFATVATASSTAVDYIPPRACQIK
jgi:hypothetical protein